MVLVPEAAMNRNGTAPPPPGWPTSVDGVTLPPGWEWRQDDHLLYLMQGGVIEAVFSAGISRAALEASVGFIVRKAI